MSFSITGLASGMDTAQMIELMMKIERLPYEKLQTRRQELTQEQNVIRNINTKLAALRDAANDLLYNASFQVKSARTSDASVVSATAAEGAANGSHQIQVVQLAQKHIVASAEFAKGGPASGLQDQQFKLFGKGDAQGKIFTLSGNTYEEMLVNLRDAINQAGMGVRATLMETKPGHVTLVLTSEHLGAEGQIRLEGVPDDSDLTVLKALGFVYEDENDEQDKLNTKQEAQNTVVFVNGIRVETEGNTLTNVLPGLTINLLKPGDATVTVETDADAIADKIQKFVDAYNDVFTAIRAYTGKGAILQGDTTLNSLYSRLYSLLSDPVGGAGDFRFLFEIGLEIDRGVTSGGGMTGTISFDRNKFKEAFAANPEAVARLFTHDEPDSFSQDGVAVRFYNEILNWTRTGTGYLTSKIAGYDTTLKDITDQMERLDLRLQNRQKQLEAQFAAMETALAQLRSQQAWLAAQINILSMSLGS